MAGTSWTQAGSLTLPGDLQYTSPLANLIKATLQSRLEAVWSGQKKSDLVRKSQIWSDLDEFQSENARDLNRGSISGKSWTV